MISFLAFAFSGCLINYLLSVCGVYLPMRLWFFPFPRVYILSVSVCTSFILFCCHSVSLSCFSLQSLLDRLSLSFSKLMTTFEMSKSWHFLLHRFFHLKPPRLPKPNFLFNDSSSCLLSSRSIFMYVFLFKDFLLCTSASRTNALSDLQSSHTHSLGLLYFFKSVSVMLLILLHLTFTIFASFFLPPIPFKVSTM